MRPQLCAKLLLNPDSRAVSLLSSVSRSGGNVIMRTALPVSVGPAAAPVNPRGNAVFRTFDVAAAYVTFPVTTNSVRKPSIRWSPLVPERLQNSVETGSQKQLLVPTPAVIRRVMQGVMSWGAADAGRVALLVWKCHLIPPE